MIQYWTNLNEREQWMIGVGTAFVVIYLIYSLIYSPLQSLVHTKTKLLKENKVTLSWMQHVRQQAKGSNNQQTITRNKLLTIIAAQLSNDFFQQFQHQIKQTTQGNIELTFEKVPYLPFLEWLWKLENRYALSISQLMFEITPVNGVVKVNLILMI